MKKPLSKGLKTFYGIGDFGFSLMTFVEMYYFVIFLTDVAKFSLGMVALIGSITSIVDAVLSPFYGAIISGTKPLKWGRNRSWLLVAPPIVMILYMFMYTKIGPEPVAAAIVCAGFILSHIIWNIAWVANLSLIPVLATTPEEGGLLASRRAAYSTLAGVLFSFIATPMIKFFTGLTGSPVLAYTLLAGAMALLMWIGYWVVFGLTKGYEPTGEELAKAAEGAPKEEKVSVGAMLRNVVENPPLLGLLLADFFRYMPMFIGTAAAAYYFTYVAQNMNLFTVFLFISSLASTVGAYCYGFISKKISQRTAAIAGLFVSVALMIAAKFVAMNVTLFIAVMALNGIIAGAYGPAWVGMYSDVATYGEWKTGKNATPFIMGLMNLPLKASIIARTAIIPIVLGAAGFVANADPATATMELKNAVVNVYVVIPAMFTLIAALIATFGYKLTNEKLAKYRAEIEARRSGATIEVVTEGGETL